jgi:uncharacterized membrane protein
MIAIISSISLANWLFILYLLIKDGHSQSTVVIVYAIACSYILNIVFFILYLKVLRNDEFYEDWREENEVREKILVVSALLTSFQLYRIAF